MRLPAAPAAYDRGNEAGFRAAVASADQENFKRGRDVELVGAERLILKDTATGQKYALVITSGALVITGPL